MWEQRSLPWIDPWSFTRGGQPWLHHEWLADVIYEGWVRGISMESLVYWKWGVMLATFLMLLRMLHRLTDNVVAGVASALLAIATAAPFLDLRPHLYSLLGYVVLLSLLFLRPRPSWFLPLLFAVWVNLHGGFFFGLMALTVVLAITLWWAPPPLPERLRAAAIWLGCLLAGFLNPYGFHVFGYPLKYAFDTSSPFRVLLTEWSSPLAPGGVEAPLYPWALALCAMAVTVIFVTGSFRDRRGLVIAAMALTGLTLAMSLTSRRFIPLFAVTSSLLVGHVLAWLARHLAGAVPRVWSRLAHPALRGGAAIVVAGCSAAWLVAHPPLPSMFSVLTAEDTFPAGVTRFIAAHRLTGTVFAQWTYGGYLQLHAPGLMRVYVDQRADTVFDADTYLKYLQVNGRKPGWTTVVEASGAEYFWWPRFRGSVAPLLSSGRWRILQEDRVSVLLVRADVPLPAGLTAGAPSLRP